MIALLVPGGGEITGRETGYHVLTSLPQPPQHQTTQVGG